MPTMIILLTTALAFLGSVYLLECHGFADGAELTEAIGCDDIVEFVAQTGEVTPGTKAVVADEVGELMLGLPLVDELRDEVDACR